jgi:hypothetical protein
VTGDGHGNQFSGLRLFRFRLPAAGTRLLMTELPATERLIPGWLSLVTYSAHPLSAYRQPLITLTGKSASLGHYSNCYGNVTAGKHLRDGSITDCAAKDGDI